MYPRVHDRILVSAASWTRHCPMKPHVGDSVVATAMLPGIRSHACDYVVDARCIFLNAVSHGDWVCILRPAP